MSDCESDLTIDLKSNDVVQEDFSIPSTSTQSKSRLETKDLVEEIDSGVSENNEDSDSESGEHCAICLSLIRGKIGSPDAEGCEHYFCLLCILEWTKNNPTCPQDRRPFKRILVRENIYGDIVSTLEANKSKADETELEVEEDLTYCEVCGSCEREDCLLLCDGCDLGFHLECLSPPLLQVPIEEWFCPLCVATDLPSVIEKAESQKNERESKNQRKKKKKLKRKPRMIPRTRASERVLRRINKTRIKEAKTENDMFEDEDEKKSGTVHLFRKARPYGRITDDDIDAAFNQDDYADKLLSSSYLSSNEKKDIAVKALSDKCSTPLPSYSGRSSHPKLGNCEASVSNTDLLINILEEQDILLSKTKDVSLTKERKLIKNDGAKSLDFNIDRENRVMSELLPSQKKALQTKDKEDKYESESSRDANRDSKHRKYEEKHKHSKDNFSNGHSSSYKRSYSSPRKSRDKDSYSSYKSKSYRNYDKKLDRKYDRDYRNKDSRRYRDRTSRERKEYSNASSDYYDRRRSRRSRSKSWERRRTERKHKRRSRTPERHKNKEKNLRNNMPASSFWAKSFVDTFTDIDIKNNSYDDNSFHTIEISSTSQENDSCFSDISNKTEELPNKKVNNLKKEEGISFEIGPTVSAHQKSTFYKSQYKEKLEVSDLQRKCDNYSKKSNLIEEKRKLEENDYNDETESKKQKQRLKSLFGDEGSDQDSPIHHLHKLNSSKISSNEKQKESFEKEPSKQNLELENNLFQNYKNPSLYNEVCIVNDVQHPVPKDSSFPLRLTSPLHSCQDEQDTLGDITTLSEASRDFIMKSLFGTHQVPTQETNNSDISKTEKKDFNVSGDFHATVQVAAGLEKLDSKINNKNTDNTRENHSLKGNTDSSVIELQKNTDSSLIELKKNTDSSLVEPKKNTKTANKMFAHLFGDSSDSETSNSVPDKNSESGITHKVSKEYAEQKKPFIGGKDLISSEPKLIQKPVIEEKPNDIVINETEKKDKLNMEGAQGIESRCSSLDNKIKVNKLHLEMKVVDETKRFLNPFYLEKGFSKQIYKEIVSKCVNKVLEVESGNTVDPKKIQKLVNGYVQVYMHRNKKSTNNNSSSVPQPKSDGCVAEPVDPSQ